MLTCSAFACSGHSETYTDRQVPVMLMERFSKADVGATFIIPISESIPGGHIR